MNTPLLEIRHLSHRFSNGQLGLDNVSMNMQKGEFLVLAGSNGSGKTLLMRHLNGLLRPDSGEILLDGISIWKDLATTRRRVGLVFQNAEAQIVGQTVAKDTAFGPENLKLGHQEIQQRVEWALKSTGLIHCENRRPYTLSGGELRRLAVAGVLAMRPDILVLDEPFTGLDWPGSSDLVEVLVNLHAGGAAILLITHDLEKILGHANRLILMNKGCIHANGNPQDLLEELEPLGVRRPQGNLAQMTWKKM